MEGLRTEVTVPNISTAMVIGYAPEQNSVYIQLPSGQHPAFPARVLYLGQADGIRVHQLPLPIVGTWGLVCFPYGDSRFPIWLGAYYPNNNVNAITSDNTVPSGVAVDYYSHWSGYYSLLDAEGQEFIRFPDGTQLNISSDGSQPATYRHTVGSINSDVPNPQQGPVRIEVPDDFRVPDPPDPFYVDLEHPSGASVTITPSGMVTIVGGDSANASITITPSGIVHIQTGSDQTNGTGPIVDLDPTQGTVQILGQSGNAQILMDKDGNIKILSAVDIIIDASAGGNIYVKTQQHNNESIDNIIDTFNSHTHDGVQGGTDNTAPPNQLLP